MHFAWTRLTVRGNGDWLLGLPMQMVKESDAVKRATQGFETEKQQLLGYAGQQQQQDGSMNPAGDQLRGQGREGNKG